MENKQTKKISFSAIQPSGSITLGNYLGAIKNWIKFQDEFNCIFSLADLHTITVKQDPSDFRKHSLEAYALLLACGIDLDKSIFFIQSHVHTHPQLAWILNCFTQFGELARMTQFKDKSVKHSDNINCGLFTYPSLMAADILLYNTDVVPVGADQKQHVELCRNIAERFNHFYGETFKIPEPFIPNVGARIMSLQDPKKKMSKSDDNVNSFITILDDKDTIARKFKRAVTDSEAKVRYAEGKDGINNLMGIYSLFTQKTNEQIEDEFYNKGYGDFKMAVAESVIEALSPIQEKYHKLISDKAYLEECYRKCDEIALQISERTLRKVMKKMGFLNR